MRKNVVEIKKSVLFCMLALAVLIMGNSIPVQASSNTKVNIVGLGDSITTGYGLNAGEKSYIENFADSFSSSSAYVTNLGIDGLKSSELLAILDNIIEADSNNSASKENALKELSSYNIDEADIDALKSANFITVSIGSNDILEVIQEATADEFKKASMNEAFDYVKEQYALYNKAKNEGDEATADAIFDDLYTHIVSLRTKITYKASSGTNSTYALRIVDSINKFKGENGVFVNIVNNIKKINPNAKVFITNIYNPYVDFIISSKGITVMNLEKITETYLALINEAFSKNNEFGYNLIDVYSAFSDTNEYVNANINEQNPDPHPNSKGHALIGKLMAEERDNLAYVKGDVNCDNIVDMNDAVLVLSKALNNDNILEAEKIYDSRYMNIVDVDSDNIVTAKDSSEILQKSLNSSYSFSGQ